MLADINAGKIGTVIVKDISRLRQNYLQVGMYTEMVFLEKGVCFIAINGGVDSAHGDNDFVYRITETASSTRSLSPAVLKSPLAWYVHAYRIGRSPRD